MNSAIDLWRELWAVIVLPTTWSQLLALVAGALIAVAAGRRVQDRISEDTISLRELDPGVLALMPFLWWLWLLAATIAFRRWHLPTDLLHYGVLLVGALALIRAGVFVLRRSLSPGVPLQAWEGALSFTIFGLVALHIVGWLDPLTEVLDEYALMVGKLRISLLTVSSFLLSIAFLLLIALSLATTINDRLLKAESLTPSMRIALTKVSKSLLLTFAILIALATAGIDLTALTIVTGAIGVGLALGLQRNFSNFLSGFVLAFEESVKPGDIIGIGTTTGTVQSLNVRHVVVHNEDGADVLIPNDDFVTSQITNWTQAGHIRLHLPLKLSADVDLAKALPLMQRIAHAQPNVLRSPPGEAHILTVSDKTIDVEIVVCIGLATDRTAVRTALYLALWQELSRQHISLGNPSLPAAVVAGVRSS